jgi:hypothetical protein
VAGLASSVKITGGLLVGMLALLCLLLKIWTRSVRIGTAVASLIILGTACLALIFLLNPYLWDLGHPAKLFSIIRNWSELLALQTRLGLGPWGGSRLVTLNQTAWLGFQSFPLEWTFLCCGTILGAWRLIRSLRKKEVDPSAIPYLFFWINFLFISVFMPLHWDRYYLPTVIAARFVTAMMIYDVLSYLPRRARSAAHLRGGEIS